MAYINVGEWSVENVVDWLKGKRILGDRLQTKVTQGWEVAGPSLSNERSFHSHPIFGKIIANEY